MADWSKSNRACNTLWTTLHAMQQLSSNFEDSGEMKMNDLTFYNTLGSSELRKQQAQIIAEQIDNTFRVGRGAKYEINMDRTLALSGMIEILTDESKQVKDLASIVDISYKFWGESK